MLATVRSVSMRLFRAIGLISVGAFAGFASPAAIAKRALPSRGDAESDDVFLVAIFDGVELKSRATAFRGGSMFSWFGGIAVDLREARLGPGAHLDLDSLFGGIALRVPPDWRIESRVKAFSGGVAIGVPEPDDPDAPTLTLDGFAAFGGLAVGARAAETAPET